MTNGRISDLLKKHALVVLDAHRNPWDIFITAIFFRRNPATVRIFMPVAGYAEYVPFMNTAMSVISRIYGITLIPVFRSDEYAPPNVFKRFLCSFYPKGLHKRIRKLGNDAYMRTVLDAVGSPGTVIIVAPFGAIDAFGGPVKYGVRRLMEAADSVVVSHSSWSFRSVTWGTRIGPYTGDIMVSYGTIGCIR